MNLIRSHATGYGEPLDPAKTRMLLALRINVLAKGHSGISLDNVEKLVKAFNGKSGERENWDLGRRDGRGIDYFDHPPLFYTQLPVQPIAFHSYLNKVGKNLNQLNFNLINF